MCVCLGADTNAALHYYSHDNVRTTKGVLNITTEQKVNSYKAFDEKKKVFYADKKYIQSGMLQSWNKFCFVGGVVEFSAKLPGDPLKGGLWPACESTFAFLFLLLFAASWGRLIWGRRSAAVVCALTDASPFFKRFGVQCGCWETWRVLRTSDLQTLYGLTATTNATREIGGVRRSTRVL